MDAREVERVVAEAETALAGGTKVDLAEIGFWRAVAAAKRDPQITGEFGERIARIDRLAFERAVPLRLPASIGLTLHMAGTVIGVVLMAAAVGADAPWRELGFLAGVAAVLGATHILGHWLVGLVVGIRFTHWFSRPPLMPQPGLKVEYTSYLRVPARSRAWMHASGAIVSKLVPFAAYPFAVAAGLDAWATWLLLGLGVVQLVTDATLSTRFSDWKRFRREMSYAR